jgi:enoyl-[acyl-carrier protein] reductase I
MGLLTGKKALVSGTANHMSIAWGIAKAMHAHGAQIALTCLESNIRRLKKLAPQVHSDIVIPCDVRDDYKIGQAFDQVKEVFDGRLDILVHSLAYADLKDIGGEFIRISRSGWSTALEISAYSLIVFARHVRPLMNASGGGSIITVTFGGGEKVVPGYNIMGVSKAALETTVRYLAYDLGPENIRVNAISPGPIPTPSSLMVEDFGTALKMTEEHSPMLRNITLEDVGGAEVYLASDLSSGVTGAIIKVDSGMNIVGAPAKAHPKLKRARNG